MQDLARFLVALGPRIDGIGTNTMVVHGPATLGAGSYRIGPDHIEVGSLIGLAAVTRSPLRIARAGVEHLRSIRMGFERLGIVCEVEGDDLIVPSGQTLKIQGRFRRPHSEARGSAVAGVSRRSDVDRHRNGDAVRRRDPDVREDVRVPDVLRRQADLDGRPDRAVRSAPGDRGRPEPAAGRADDFPRHPRRHGDAAGRGLRRGTSTINNAEQIERGYERIDERLNALGARITRVPERADQR